MSTRSPVSTGISLNDSAPYAEAANELRSVRDVLRFGVGRMVEAGISFGHGTRNALDEAAYLTAHALHLNSEQLDSFLDARLTHRERASVLKLFERRIDQRIPAAYLTGEAWLGDYRFRVDARVIVPRSTLAELIRDGLSPWISDATSVKAALDLCTGSACLAILLAETFPHAQVDAVELSGDALAVAALNVQDYQLEQRVKLVHGDLLSAVPAKRYDLIVSNPPYVNAQAMAALPPEFRREPEMALAGGMDGLDLVRKILESARAHLNEGGVLVVEIGHNREAIEQAYPRLPFRWLNTSAGADLVFLLERENLP